MENVPLYNSIIIKTYVDFLEDSYPDLNIKELLEYSNITNYELEDRGHWLTQKHANTIFTLEKFFLNAFTRRRN